MREVGRLVNMLAEARREAARIAERDHLVGAVVRYIDSAVLEAETVRDYRREQGDVEMER